jgi:two-component system, chemotaxis family, CheB/CheR fusion protein
MKPKSSTHKKRNVAPQTGNDLLIAAIGASAGGIEAFQQLIQHLPADSGMAFVLIQHLDPKHHSMLTELVSKKTEMPVTEVTDGMRVKANHVYVIPPNATMSISNHTLQLVPRDSSSGIHMSIDHFMRSLAEAQGNRAIGVILSGYGTDGTLGMAEIQAQGGVTLAQDEGTAKFDSMPRSAIAAGFVDYVLPPKDIARELARIARHPYVAPNHTAGAELVRAAESGLGAIFQLLRKKTGVDFTQYRQSTIFRRIHRRMVVHKIDKIREYVRHVQAHPAEIKALYQDILINVTSFFRNPSVFEALKEQVFPNILKNRSPDAAIRLWTPGCASGEETYSMAIVLLEFLGERSAQVPIQFFGTDVSDVGIVKARNGVYPENIEGDVSPERLRRFFSKIENGYRISKSIRDLCIFAQHNVLSDPPFSQMDIICCRNLLIYLEPPAQNRVISLFHCAARPGGYLVLGTSEGVGSASNLFSTEDRSLRIFSKTSLPARQVVTFSLNRARGDSAGPSPVRLPGRPPDSSWNYLEAQKEFDRRLLTHFAPAAAFINEGMDIIHTRGNIGRFFKLAPGRASLSILKMAREGLLLDLRNAIDRAKKLDRPVRKHNVQVKGENGDSTTDTVRLVNFEVAPIRIGNTKELYFMIVLEDVAVPPLQGKRRHSKKADEWEAEAMRIAKLELELAATKEYLQSVIETQEATNEELQSANEEILSSNEELQSTNEELETAKEELQSANEELSTVNDELRNRNAEMSQMNNDLSNVIASIDMAMVMVGSDLIIRRFSPQAQRIFGLIPADVGRPLTNINPAIDIPGFRQMLMRVMSTSQPFERTITDRNSGSYLVRVVPYRLADHKIDGAVITVIPSPEPAESAPPAEGGPQARQDAAESKGPAAKLSP